MRRLFEEKIKEHQVLLERYKDIFWVGLGKATGLAGPFELSVLGGLGGREKKIQKILVLLCCCSCKGKMIAKLAVLLTHFPCSNFIHSLLKKPQNQGCFLSCFSLSPPSPHK